MTVMKTSELEGRPLDWAAGLAIGRGVILTQAFATTSAGGHWDGMQPWDTNTNRLWQPRLDWRQGGPLLEGLINAGFELGPSFDDAEGVQLSNYTDEGLPYPGWTWEDDQIVYAGHSILVAACRTWVGWKIGEYVDVPEDLIDDPAQ